MLNEVSNGYTIGIDDIVVEDEQSNKSKLKKAIINKELYYIKTGCFGIPLACMGEYISNRFLYTLGYNVAETFLGRHRGLDCIIIKNFVPSGWEYLTYSELIDNNPKYSGLNIEELARELTMEHIDRLNMQRQYWGQFIGDALLLNENRKPNDWGFLRNKSTGSYKAAPIHSNSHTLDPYAVELMGENRLEITSWEALATCGKPYGSSKGFIQNIQGNKACDIFFEELIQLSSVGASKIIAIAKWASRDVERRCPRLLVPFYIKLIVLRYLCIICGNSYPHALDTYRKFERQAELANPELLDYEDTSLTWLQAE